MTQLWVGLGNPGAKYANHRHNIGFQWLDAVADDCHAPTWGAKFSGLLTDVTVEDEKIYLLKPQTFMNRSGQSVSAALQFFKLPISSLTVFHDELDIATAKLKVKTGGGHGGHNGLRDIDAHCGKEYRRYRLGIDHPGHKDAVSGYVLHDFGKEQRAAMDNLLEGLLTQLPSIAAGHDATVMNEIARRT